MNKREELITLYVNEFSSKCRIDADLELLTKITIGCGPSIYNKDAATVSCSDASELATVRNNYLIKKLGLTDNSKLDEAIEKVCNQLGSSNKNKYRAMFYYLLCKEFGKEAVYS